MKINNTNTTFGQVLQSKFLTFSETHVLTHISKPLNEIIGNDTLIISREVCDNPTRILVKAIMGKKSLTGNSFEPKEVLRIAKEIKNSITT